MLSLGNPSRLLLNALCTLYQGLIKNTDLLVKERIKKQGIVLWKYQRTQVLECFYKKGNGRSGKGSVTWGHSLLFFRFKKKSRHNVKRGRCLSWRKYDKRRRNEREKWEIRKKGSIVWMETEKRERKQENKWGWEMSERGREI